jgi:hypothetical protein
MAGSVSDKASQVIRVIWLILGLSGLLLGYPGCLIRLARLSYQVIGQISLS